MIITGKEKDKSKEKVRGQEKEWKIFEECEILFSIISELQIRECM